MRQRAPAVLLVAVLTGCAGYSHQTASNSDFNRDRYQCQMETSNAYPNTQTAMGPGYQTQGRVNCSSYGNQTNCTTTPGRNIGAPVQDTNMVPRAMAFDSCMQARGYTR